jgi:hypothetical protein
MAFVFLSSKREGDDPFNFDHNDGLKCLHVPVLYGVIRAGWQKRRAFTNLISTPICGGSTAASLPAISYFDCRT